MEFLETNTGRSMYEILKYGKSYDSEIKFYMLFFSGEHRVTCIDSLNIYKAINPHQFIQVFSSGVI